MPKKAPPKVHANAIKPMVTELTAIETSFHKLVSNRPFLHDRSVPALGDELRLRRL
jgi:hypothetical protein